MTEKKRIEKCEEFKNKYIAKMGGPGNLTSERKITIENICNLKKLTEVDKLPRRNSTRIYLSNEMERILGRLRDPKIDRKCITDDMDIINFYIKELNETPPSFIEAGPRKILHFNPKIVKIGILTSGGIAPGLNTIIESIVEKHIKVYGLTLAPDAKGKIYGFKSGFVGLENNEYEELNAEKVKGWCQFGGSKIGVGCVRYFNWGNPKNHG
ncbi:MAG: 6-phosphofructokinase [Dictyoglomaceae bacterium]|nr:6-phosphofructokinase [Dictyoglomaceae bacterium]